MSIRVSKTIFSLFILLVEPSEFFVAPASIVGNSLPETDHVDDSDQDDLGNIKVSDTNEELPKTPDELKPKSYDYLDGSSLLLEKLKTPVLLFSSDNPQRYYFDNDERKPETGYSFEPGLGFNFNDQLTSMSELNNALYHDCMKATLARWRNFQNRRSRSFPQYWSNFGLERPLKYVDYTNSQMPFNEGKVRQKTTEGMDKKSTEVSDDNWPSDKTFNYEKYSKPDALPARVERSMRRRFEAPLKSQEENLEILPDNPVLEYSRVRRFLDHERAKKRKRMQGTLEAKEAAMSRVLDPNLNLDGILEPHVRKRRGKANFFVIVRPPRGRLRSNGASAASTPAFLF